MNTLLRSARIPFLLLTPIYIFYAYAIVIYQHHDVAIDKVILVLITALFAHISVNTLNEYLDFTSGLDLDTIRTAFSGGSGALPEDSTSAHAVLVLGVVSLIITIVSGLYLVYIVGAGLILPGLIGVLIILFYTRTINRMPWLCLIAPGVGFGLLFVYGSYYVFTGQNNVSAAVLSLIPFALANNLLLLNQYPDISADRRAGRNHFPIAYGIEKSNRVYLGFILLAVSVLIISVASGMIPVVAIVGLAPVIAGLYAYRGTVQLGSAIAQQPSYLAANVLLALVMPLTIGLALVV